MVKLIDSQRNKLLLGRSETPMNIHLTVSNCKESGIIDSILTDQQKKRIEKRVVKGKGLRIKISPSQQKQFIDLVNKEKVKGMKMGGKKSQEKREDRAKKWFIDNTQLRMIVKELFDQIIVPVVKEKTGRKPTYTETYEKLLLTYLATQPEIINKIKDIQKIKDVDVFVKSIYDPVPIQGYRKGKGILSDGWDVAKAVFAKTAEVGVNLATNTSKNVMKGFKQKYVDNPLNLIVLLGLVTDTALSTGGVGAIAVLANELGTLIAPAILEAIKTELDVQLPENVADPLKKAVTVLEGVNYARTTVNQIESALTGKVAEKAISVQPKLKSVQQGALEVTDVAKDILSTVPVVGTGEKRKRGRPRKNKELAEAINGILKSNK